MKLVIVSGTATEVGKTWVGAALARELRGRGVTVAARKPDSEKTAPPPGSWWARIPIAWSDP